MSARLTVEGNEELELALKGLPHDIRRTILADAIRPEGEAMRAAIEAAVPSGPYSTGRLKGSIVFRETQIGGEPSGVVVPNRKKGGGGKHAHLVEHGAAPHAGKYYGRPSQHPGAPAQPFFQKTVDALQEGALDRMEQAVSARIDSYWESQGGPE